MSEKKEQEVRSISYFALFRYASKCDCLLICTALSAAFMAAASTPYAIMIIGGVFQDMINYEISLQTGKKQPEVLIDAINLFCIKNCFVGVIVFFGIYLSTAFMEISAINQIYKIRIAYFKAALNQDFSYYDVHQAGDFASRMSGDIIKLEDGIGEKLSSIVFCFTVSISCITMALIRGWKLALLCTLSSPISFLMIVLLHTFAQRLSKKEAAAAARASNIAEEVLSSIRTVYAFNGQQKEYERYKIPLAEAKKSDIKKELIHGITMGLIYFVIFCSYGLSFFFGVYLIVHDPKHYNADVMFSVFMGVMYGMVAFGMIGTLLGAIGSACGAGAHIFHLIDTKPTNDLLLDPGIKPASIKGSIEFKNVVFSYPTRPDVVVLNDVSFTVNRGQSVALVGSSGCGKSTIIQLLLRCYDVDMGKVLVDDFDVRELSVVWLRAQMGVVGQEPVLFNKTVRENIRIGRMDASDAEIEVCSQQSNAHNFIKKLPKGYDTLVGERGASLSGGQKQRIAIARALIRRPTFLLLDEATSALDTKSEAIVQRTLDQVSKGLTTIIVAHRLSTIRNVDVIYVLKEGVIVEQGDHNSLMELKGIYYDMFSLQAPELVASSFDKKDLKENLIPSPSHSEQIFKTLTQKEKEEVTESKPVSISLFRMFKLSSPEWKFILMGCICSIGVGCSMPIYIFLFGNVFGALSISDTGKLMDLVVKISIGCSLIGLVMFVTTIIESVTFGIAGARLSERLRLMMFGHLMKQQISFFDDHSNSTGALCSQLSSEAAYVRRATGARISSLVQGVGAVVFSLILAMVFEYRIGLVACATIPLLACVVYFQSKITTAEGLGNAKALKASSKIAMEAVSNFRTVATLGQERIFLEEYAGHLRSALKPAKWSAHVRGLVAGMSRSMFNFLNAAMLALGGHLIVSEGVQYQNVLVATQALQLASGQVQNAFMYSSDFERGMDAAARAITLMNTQPTMSDPESPIVTSFKSSGRASFENVEFKYPTRPAVKVLQGLNLQVMEGTTIALVGESGCGKSTVVSLLLRYYDPEAGVVALDGYPLPQLLIREIRASLGLVSQEPVLFDRSIRENIAYGNNDRPVAMEEIFEAAKHANIHNFILSLPEAYESNIGARGVQLSGGQKQRVAIARALIRQPKILLLDEATSALDTESEKMVQEALDQARMGRSCIVIAHRLSTVRDADLIYVIERGRVAEAGNHDELINLKGLYYNLNTKGL